MRQISVDSAPWYSDQDPEGSFAFLHDCGFDAVDLGMGARLSSADIRKGALTTFFDQSEEELRAFYRPVKEAAARHDVAFSQMHAPFPLYIKGETARSDYMLMVVEKCCAVARFLDCPALVVHPAAARDKEEERRVNLAMYRRMIPAAKRYGVKLCLENLYSTFGGRMVEGGCTDADDACFYIDTLNEEAGADLFGFCFDLGHATLTGRDPRRYLNQLGKRLTILHIHDNDGRRDRHMMPYTFLAPWAEGGCVTDWEGFLAGLRDIGYQGSLSFEVFHQCASMPRPIWPQVMKTIAAIGRCWAARLDDPAEKA